MYCPRLDHFVRLEPNGKFGRCGHMVKPKQFDSLEEMERSDWLYGLKRKMSSNEWPAECSRCEMSESHKKESIRTNSLKRHRVLEPLSNDYLIVGGVLDNVCNSACQTCNPHLSTKIGSLQNGKHYKRIDNYVKFWELPSHRIVELDVNGGEPTASKNYKKILSNLPKKIKIVRMNTNGSKIINEIEELLKRDIKVIVTLSLDGVGKIHDYVRWPIKWSSYERTVDSYLGLQQKYKLLSLDSWTTVSCLNVNDMPNILDFSKQKNIPHDWAFLTHPVPLNVGFKNRFTEMGKSFSPNKIAVGEDNSKILDAFILRQDTLRNIKIQDYLNF